MSPEGSNLISPGSIQGDNTYKKINHEGGCPIRKLVVKNILVKPLRGYENFLYPFPRAKPGLLKLIPSGHIFYGKLFFNFSPEFK